MLRVTLDNVAQKRTIRPLYAQHQATPYGCFLNPERDRTHDILPGMVMTRISGEVVDLMGTGDNAAKHEVFGLSALFIAPQLGIDETINTGMNNYAVWVGDEQSVFEILAPAFDTSATWTVPTDGSSVPLYVTNATHAEGPGKLTPVTTNAHAKVAAHLIDVVGDNKIIVSLDKTAPASGA